MPCQVFQVHDLKVAQYISQNAADSVPYLLWAGASGSSLTAGLCSLLPGRPGGYVGSRRVFAVWSSEVISMTNNHGLKL